MYGHPTGEPWNPYRSTTHEFAHIIRDKYDGDASHWHADDLEYVYGRSHNSCGGPWPGPTHAGCAFHEGWAEYWSDDTACCVGDLGNEDIEGTVARDLLYLEKQTWVESGQVVSVGKKGMALVLARGPNLIHSQSEFRREFGNAYPNATPGPLGSGVSQPAASTSRAVTYLIIDKDQQRRQLAAAIHANERSIAWFREQQREASGVQAFIFRSSAHEGELVGERLRDQIDELDREDPPERHLQRGFLERRKRADSLGRRCAAQLLALRAALSVAASAEERTAITRRIQLLTDTRVEDGSLQSMIPLPPLPGDDTFRDSAEYRR